MDAWPTSLYEVRNIHWKEVDLFSSLKLALNDLQWHSYCDPSKHHSKWLLLSQYLANPNNLSSESLNMLCQKNMILSNIIIIHKVFECNGLGCFVFLILCKFWRSSTLEKLSMRSFFTYVDVTLDAIHQLLTCTMDK